MSSYGDYHASREQNKRLFDGIGLSTPDTPLWIEHRIKARIEEDISRLEIRKKIDHIAHLRRDEGDWEIKILIEESPPHLKETIMEHYVKSRKRIFRL